MSGEPTVIFSAANAQQAYLLKGLLEERGIAAWVVNDAIQIAGGDLPDGWTGAPRVVVGLQDADEGRRVAEEFDRKTSHETQGDDEAAAEADPKEWPDWPLCPSCQEPRSALCPICGIAANNFPLADIQESSDGTRVLLFCAACDDHFLPEWYRLCPRCGYDYGGGIEVDPPRQPPEFNLRNTLVIAALVAGLLAFLTYFLWLFAGRAS